MMFRRLQLRLRDMKTLNTLISGAEQQAHLSGDEKIGAEHYVLAAITMPDGSAKRIFDKIGISVNDYKQAIQRQYEASLDAVGITTASNDIEPVETSKLFVGVQESGKEFMQSLHALKAKDKDNPLLSAHVLAVVMEKKRGVAARAFAVLGIDGDVLARAVHGELEYK